MNTRPFVVLIISLIPTLISSCFGTKAITLDHKDIQKKENILVYHADGVYQLLNFNFDSTALSGELWESTFPGLSKSQKVKYLEVYLNPAFTLPAIDNSNRYIKIPYDSIVKIERTRFRAEYGLLIIPIYFIGGISIYYIGGMLQPQH